MEPPAIIRQRAHGTHRLKSRRGRSPQRSPRRNPVGPLRRRHRPEQPGLGTVAPSAVYDGCLCRAGRWPQLTAPNSAAPKPNLVARFEDGRINSLQGAPCGGCGQPVVAVVARSVVHVVDCGQTWTRTNPQSGHKHQPLNAPHKASRAQPNREGASCMIQHVVPMPWLHGSPPWASRNTAIIGHHALLHTIHEQSVLATQWRCDQAAQCFTSYNGRGRLF